jgi:hypothetical protein
MHLGSSLDLGPAAEEPFHTRSTPLFECTVQYCPVHIVRSGGAAVSEPVWHHGPRSYSTSRASDAASSFSTNARGDKANSKSRTALLFLLFAAPADHLQEENRLRAKALRERALATEQANSSSSAPRTPSGFSPSETSVAGQKRPHESISSSSRAPQTVRDAREGPADAGIQAARKFKKYIDHDFSKMTDTKGGFLSTEDDPYNRVLNAPEKDGGKPAHMTLKEWERHQLLKSLRQRREGPFEPGLNLLSKDGVKCRECGTPEIDWQWEEVFHCAVCSRCKEKFPEKYSLLTKTEAKDDYLLTDRKNLAVDYWRLWLTCY